MDFKSLKNIKSFHVLIIPDQGGAGSRSKKLTVNQLILIIAIYTCIAGLLGFFILSITPFKGLIFPSDASLSSNEIEKIDQLNQRLYFLSKELESLKSTNERLKYAIMLGDSTLIDSLENKIDTSKASKLKGAEGNLYAIIKMLFFNDKDKPTDNDFFIKPVNGFISREFFPEKGHLGIDLVVKTGTPVYSAASGFIIFSDYTAKDGYMVIINHSNDYISIYKHCSSLLKKERDLVLQGELIALSGNSGEITTGPHLHFEIWKNGKPIDPKTVFIKY